MNIDQTTLVAIAAIVSVTVITSIALIRNTNTKLNLNLGKDFGFLTIEGKRSLPESTKVDCLPGDEDCQTLNCDSN